MLQPLPLQDAEIALDPDWLPVQEAARLLAALQAAIPWQVHRIRMFGREVDSPRLSCWIGDPGAIYTYSRTTFEPRPWPATLLPVRARLREATGIDFNSVLANLYRDGRDYMGWHSDNEPALGPRPVIASVSLGATRRFVLKHRGATAGPGIHDGPRSLALPLNAGSLLLMRGDTQRHYRHALPRTAKAIGPRVNLTFRRIVPD